MTNPKTSMYAVMNGGWILSPIKKPDVMIQLLTSTSDPIKENDFDGLLAAIKAGTMYVTKINGFIVKLIPNVFTEHNLFSLYINDTLSNDCRGATMAKYIREWKAGKRIAKESDGDSGLTLLYKNYEKY